MNTITRSKAMLGPPGICHQTVAQTDDSTGNPVCP